MSSVPNTCGRKSQLMFLRFFPCNVAVSECQFGFKKINKLLRKHVLWRCTMMPLVSVERLALPSARSVTLGIVGPPDGAWIQAPMEPPTKQGRELEIYGIFKPPGAFTEFVKGVLLAFAAFLFPASDILGSPPAIVFLNVSCGFLQDNICLLQSIKHFYGKAGCVGRRSMTKHDIA